MPFKDLEQKHNLVNRVILACGKHPVDADINPLLEERLERFYEDAVIEGMAKQMHSSVDRAVNAMAKPEQEPQMIQIKDGQFSYIKKPWVSLTDDEVYEIANFCKDQPFNFYAKEIENKLRSKNAV
jgi:hypothetical protein